MYENFKVIYDSYYVTALNSTWWKKKAEENARKMLENLFWKEIETPAKELLLLIIPEIMKPFLSSVSIAKSTYDIVKGLLSYYESLKCIEIAAQMDPGSGIHTSETYHRIRNNLEELVKNTEDIIDCISFQDLNKLFEKLEIRKSQLEKLFIELKSYDDLIYLDFTKVKNAIAGINTKYVAIRTLIGSLRGILKVDYEVTSFNNEGVPRNIVDETSSRLEERDLTQIITDHKHIKLYAINTFEQPSESKVYEIKVTDEEARVEKFLNILTYIKVLRVELFNLNKKVQYKIYLKYGSPPTPNNYDYMKTVDGESSVWLEVELKSGDYYVLICCPSEYGDYTIKVDIRKKLLIFEFSLYSPATILLVNPDGLKTGFDIAANTTFNEIPESTYSGPQAYPQIIKVKNPTPGNYTIILNGNGEGKFTLHVLSLANETVVVESLTFKGEIAKGLEKIGTLYLNDSSRIIQVYQNFSETVSRMFCAGIYDGITYLVEVHSNSTVSKLEFSDVKKCIKVNISGPLTTVGFCNITIPKALLGGPYTVKIDNTIICEDYDFPSNITHVFIYLLYNHSEHTIEIVGKTVIPEFPSVVILSLCIATSMLAVVLTKIRKGRLNRTCSI